MRKTMISQSHLQHDQLIINYKQDDITKIENFLPIWTEVWAKFQTDICSYIVPSNYQSSGQKDSMLQQQYGRENVLSVNQARYPKHSFSFPYCTRQLKRIIILHSNLDVFSEIKKQITKIFYRIANYFVNISLSINFVNLFQALVDQYKKLSPKFNVVIGCLNIILNKFITRKGLQDQFHSIIYKQLVNHQQYQNYVNCCVTAIENMRNFCLKITSIKPNQKNIRCPSQNNPIIESLKILNDLKIFPYVQYLQRSKKYYSSIISNLPKNIWMFPALHTLVTFERLLQNVLVPDQEQLQRAKKILKNSPWRATQDQTMIRIFCKEALDQVYDDLIQYVEFLIHIGSENNRNLEDEKKEFIVNIQDKKQLLKYLWSLTKTLEKYYKNQRLKYQNSKGGINIDKDYCQKKSPMTKLLERVVDVIIDIKKFIKPQSKSQKDVKNQLYKIIEFRDHILSVISQCFDNYSKFLNMITSKIQQVIIDQQQIFNQKLCSIILSPLYRYPSPQNTQSIEQQINQIEELCRFKNNKYSFELFRLYPTKDQFIRKFQQQFTNYVIPFNKNQVDLTQQQKFIRPIQSQVGYISSKTIQRMLNDVWRNGEPVFHKNQTVVCRILCLDWPKFKQPKFRLPDSLLQVRTQFQKWFLSHPNNDKKKLRWIQQCGKITIKISGVESVFSELQASIVMLLSKSYRPMKPQQFKQILQYTENDMQEILYNLVEKNVIIYNGGGGNYQLNYQNTNPYYFHQKQKLITKSQKKNLVQRDYTSVLDALIARILKRRKSVQKTDIAKLLSVEVMVDNYQPTMEEINNALQRLKDRDIVNIDKTRGIVKYLQ